jgi:hypothetical protein
VAEKKNVTTQVFFRQDEQDKQDKKDPYRKSSNILFILFILSKNNTYKDL